VRTHRSASARRADHSSGLRRPAARIGAVTLPLIIVLACADTGAREENERGDTIARQTGSSVVAAHPRAFFEEIKRTDKLPDGVRASDLILEIEPWLGAPDASLRDGLAATLCARWIRGGLLSDDELRAAVERRCRDLGVGLGEKGDDNVLLRSFSALTLDALAARDLERPYLGEEGLHALVTDALGYLAREKDLRDWDARVGWMHATAHTGDLLRRLARNPALCEADQDAIVAGVEEKLARVDVVFTHGENRRLAQVLVALLSRKDCRVAPIEAWIGRSSARNDALWNAEEFDHRLFVRVENETQLFRELLAAMWSMPTDNVNAARVREVLLAKR
jgi:hypothetical protein